MTEQKSDSSLLRYCAVAPATLLLVAGLQFYGVSAADLSPWKGGGFGMFSTVDSPASRMLRCYIATDSKVFNAEIPARLSRLAGIATSLPTEERLEALAQALAEVTWVPAEYGYAYVDGKITPKLIPPRESSGSDTPEHGGPPSLRSLEPSEPPPVAGSIVRPRAIRVEIWKTYFDPEHARLNLSRFRKETIHLDPGKRAS
jgi:hypothetical protein